MSVDNDLRSLVKVVDSLRNWMSLSRLRVKVFYRVYGEVGKEASHVRPCFECFVYERGWPCSCLEIVLVPDKGRDVRFSLMHEWGHVYLGDRVDLVFASTVPCKSYEGFLRDLMEDIVGYSIEELVCDTVVDYVVSKHIREYRDYSVRSIREQVEVLTTINGSAEEELVEEDALMCTHLASLYVSSKALGLKDTVMEVVRGFKVFNCSIDVSVLDNIACALREEKYLYAYERFLNTLLGKYLKTKIRLAKVYGKDPLTGKDISYRCIELAKY